MQALEIADLRLVTGIHQGVEGAADQLGEATAQHDLLTEQVGLALLCERGLDDTRTGTAQAIGVGERKVAGAT